MLLTDEILAETAHNIVEDTPDLTAAHLEKTFAAMRRAFPEAMVRGHEHLAESMTNHPKDRRVLAAAVAAPAGVVVTANLRHFPPQACDPHGIRVESPDQFLCDAFDAGRKWFLPCFVCRQRESVVQSCLSKRCSIASRSSFPTSSQTIRSFVQQ